MTPLPAIVITGFLGAGKTTLLNRLLAHGSPGKKIGVIVNDFGKLNVDSRLIRHGQHPVLELSGGCVCCSLQLGLHEAVRTLAARPELDLLVIEASGISVLSALLHALTTPELADFVSVSRVIAVVDARRYPQVLHSLPVIRDQISHSNFILLNHCDEADAATVDAAKERLRRENSDAPIVVTQYGDIAFDELLNHPTRTKEVGRPAHHDQRWHSYDVDLPDDIDPIELLTRVDQLPVTVERVKGFVARGHQLYALQKVGQFPGSLELLFEQPENQLRNVLVIIAREPIELELKQTFGDHMVVAAT